MVGCHTAAGEQGQQRAEESPAKFLGFPHELVLPFRVASYFGLRGGLHCVAIHPQTPIEMIFRFPAKAKQIG